VPDKLRLAILGCGAVTRDYHLPAAVAHPNIQVTVLVDSNVQRAEDLRRSYALDCKVTSNYKTAFQEATAVINALPNSLHAPVNLEAFGVGVHVLCEKPLATSVADARACCEAAARESLVLAVAMQRRFYTNQRVLRLVLDEGMLGALEGYDWEDGTAWDWDTRSGFYFSRTQAGGGVLMDYGVHLLDCVVDWFGPVAKFEYQHDDWGGGIEANIILNLLHTGKYGNVTGRIRLSRTYTLKNRLLIRGSEACGELPAQDSSGIVIHRRVGKEELSMTLRFSQQSDSVPFHPCYAQLNNFMECVCSGTKPVVDGWQALATIELIENCYRSAKRISEPWAEIPNSG
jgi:predicted dehydrogenase